jgi:hypothetical protein
MPANNHGLTPLIDAAFAKYNADCEAVRPTVPPIKGVFGDEPDTFGFIAACRPLRAAYDAFLATPEAKAELAALAAYEAALPDDAPEPEEAEDEDDAEDEDEA